MSREHEITTNKAERPTARRASQRSSPRTPEHETRPAIPMMKFQPTSQRQDPTLGAHRGITIRWGVRAAARRRTHTTTVDLVRGW
jgi:hypothetical protein